MHESCELENRGRAVEIVALLQKHGTGRMIGFKLSEYTRGPRCADVLDWRRSDSEITGDFLSVSVGFRFLSQKIAIWGTRKEQICLDATTLDAATRTLRGRLHAVELRLSQ
jgi:hypothetical protein